MGASLPSGAGVCAGSGASVLAGVAVAVVVAFGVGGGCRVSPSGTGVFAGRDVVAAILVRAGVAPVQEIMAASVNRSRAVMESREFGIGGGPSFCEVRLPFCRSPDPFLSPCLAAISTAHNRSMSSEAVGISFVQGRACLLNVGS